LLDASVLLAGEDIDDPNHEATQRLFSGGDPLATIDLAFYEVTNVAVRSWRDHAAALRLRERIVAIGNDGGLIRANDALLASAAVLAEEHGISVYDASYVAAARQQKAQLVSCDQRDLVSKGLASLPGDAVSGSRDSESEQL
jgi:predicted nucleic acid-binding protein